MPASKNISVITLVLVFILVAAVTILISKNGVKREITTNIHLAIRNIATIQLSVQEYDVFVDESRVQTNEYFWGLFSHTDVKPYWYMHTRRAIAEIDFSKVSESDVRERNDTLYLLLPQPTVRLDTIGIGIPRVYWFTDITRENREIAKAILTGKADSVLNIEVNGNSALLMQNARVQADELVNTLVGSMYPRPICISFDQIGQEAQTELRE